MDTCVVEPGDCIASVALSYGFNPATLWEHPANAALRATRPSGYVLVPGDIVAIPDLAPRHVDCALDRRHVFRRRGVPEKLRIRLEDDDAPRVEVDWMLTVDGHVTRGRTDAQGQLEAWIRPDARFGTLVVDDAPPMPLLLGRLPPVNAPDGVELRLCNLGHLQDSERANPHAVRTALRQFQATQALAPSGVADGPTQQALAACHGS